MNRKKDKTFFNGLHDTSHYHTKNASPKRQKPAKYCPDQKEAFWKLCVFIFTVQGECWRVVKAFFGMTIVIKYWIVEHLRCH